MAQGAFEREISSWAYKLRLWFETHERFTWIALIVGVAPSPLAALSGMILASVQLYMCAKGRIPRSEQTLLIVALVLSASNFVVMLVAIAYIARTGWPLWQLMYPFWWIRWWLGREFPGEMSV